MADPLPSAEVAADNASAALAPGNPSPLRELLLLAIPTIAQMASYTAMQFLDVWLLTHRGLAADSATAAGNAGTLMFSVIALGVGSLFCVNTLVSQAYGRRDYASCGRYLWQGFYFSLLYFLPLIPFCFWQLKLFDIWHEPHLAAMENKYFRIALAGTLLKLAGTAANQYLLAINRANCVFAGAAVGMVANAVAAYALIFGKWGAPAMGMAGSAHALNIGVAVETLTYLLFVFGGPSRRMFHALDARLRWPELWTLTRIGLPAGVQILADVLAWFLFSVWVMGQFGNAAMAANVVMFRYMALSFMPIFGLSTAVTALVGRAIGQGRFDLAEQRARLGFQVAAVYAVGCCAMYIGARRPLLMIFHPDAATFAIGSQLLLIAAAYQFFDALYIIYNGALRGAGDTFVPAVATVALCWSITVAGGYAVARLFPAAGPAGPWWLATGYGVILGLFMLARWRQGRWKTFHLAPPLRIS